MAPKIEPLKGEAKTFRSHSGIDSTWIVASTDHERAASVISDRVKSDNWMEWMATHPSCVIATWCGGNVQEWLLLKHGEEMPLRVIPADQGAPWWPQRPASELGSLPEWALNALIDLGEITTPERAESKAVEKIADMHAWGFRGMALEICMKPIMQRFGAV